MSKQHIMLKIVLPIVILVLGVAGTVLMIKSRQAPAKQETAFEGALVETVTVVREDHPLAIQATGTVQARQQTELVPQVSGTVIRVAPGMQAGGFFHAGDELFAIDPVDFELAVERAKANLLKAELDLETVRAQAEIGRAEWERLHPGEAPNPLVVYEPQLKNAEAGLIAARAAVRQAELDLQRTRMTAPFNGFIRDEQIDLGQYLRSGNKVGTLTGTDLVEIIVPLPLTDLPWLEIPDRPDGKGSPVVVTLSAADQQWQWPGWVDRALGEVDPRGRMARLVVVVPDPYGRKTSATRKPELAVGSFVDVSLQGSVIPNVVVLPRLALRDEDTVWVMTDQKHLQIVPVEVLRREKNVVLVSSGLKGGERIVVTPLSGAADGLLLRTMEN